MENSRLIQEEGTQAPNHAALVLGDLYYGEVPHGASGR